MVYKLKAMDMWYRHLPGAYIVEQEHQILDKLLPLMPGACLLQIGGPSDGQLVAASSIKAKYYLSTEHVPSHSGQRVQVDLHALPILEDSVDVVVIVHLMGFCHQPSQLLQEAYRCLKPGGQLIILGFNHWSFWSLLRMRKRRKGYPWQGHFQSVYQLRRWLYRIGYHVMMSRTLCFFPPEHKRRSDKWQHFIETFAKICLPGVGSVYYVVAQKQAIGSDPLVSDWLHKKLSIKEIRPEPSYMKPEQFDSRKVK
jgi:SAM-dependent methyltransferase